MSTLKVNRVESSTSGGTCVIRATNNLGHKNLLINGGFDIWQRATDSGSNTTDGYLAADRWYLNSSGATKQVTRQTFGLAQTDVPGYPKYYLRFAVTTGNNNVGLTQRIEDVRRVQGEVTLSFWAKGTNPNGGTFDIKNRQDFGSGGSSVVDTGYGSFTVSNTWAKKTFTFTPPSISGKTIGDDNYYQINVFRQPDGDTSTNAYTIDIANVQLEFGDVATDFERLSYGDELARCQRYYYEIARGNNKVVGLTMFYNDTAVRTPIRYPVTMRTSPSVKTSDSAGHFTIYSGDGTGAGAGTQSETFATFGTSPPYVDNNAIVLSCNVPDNNQNGQAGYISANHSDAYLCLDSEI